MRILHVIPSLAPGRGGTSRAAIEMVQALINCGIDVEIATTNEDRDNLLDVPLGERILFDRVPTYFFPRYSPPVAALREFTISGAFTIWLLQNITKYDAIHIHTIFSYAPTIAMMIARLRGVPYLTTPHGMLCEWSLQQKSQKKQAYLKLIERSNLDRARIIHLTCQQELEDLSKLGFKTPTCLIPLGLTEIPAPISNARSILCETLNLPKDEPIILFLSRLHYKKGLEYLIAALAKLQQWQFRLIIAGSGTPEYEAEIRSRLSLAGIAERAQMVGFVTGERKQLLIQGSDLSALTSHSENFGISVLEALSVGTPVLVTPGVGLADIVGDRDLGYVADLNVEAIAVSVDRFLTDPDRAKLMGDRARQFIREHYTWDRIAPELIGIYQSIVDRQQIA